MLTTRRQALKTLTAAAIGSTAISRLPVMAADTTPAPATPPAPTGPYKLPPLPYAYDALEPSIDALTMHLHHDKHHQAYVNKLNEALAKEPSFTPPANVEDLLKDFSSVPESIKTAVRNQGGGHANHSLFWETLGPVEKSHENIEDRMKLIEKSIANKSEASDNFGPVESEFVRAIINDLGGLDKLKAEMSEQGGKLFGSGWVWLVLDGGKKLTIITLPNQDSPLMEGHYPLFGIDVWEHAYYLKYHNVRADYLKAIWNVVNWDFISDRYAKAMKA